MNFEEQFPSLSCLKPETISNIFEHKDKSIESKPIRMYQLHHIKERCLDKQRVKDLFENLIKELEEDFDKHEGYYCTGRETIIRQHMKELGL